MNDIDLYIFDMDGTLLDTSFGILEAVKYTLNFFGKTLPDEKDLKTFIGPPLKQSFANLADVDISECEKLVIKFREIYEEKYLFKAKLYDGIFELFKRIETDEIKMAIATYKPQIFAERLVDYFNLSKFMKIVCGSDMSNTLTKKDIIQNVLDTVAVSSLSRVVYIGDSYSDAEAADACNIKFIGAAYGFEIKDSQEDRERTHAIRLINAPLELYA